MSIDLIVLSIGILCATAHQNPSFEEALNPDKAHIHASDAATDSQPQGLWDQYGRHDFMHDLKYFQFVLLNTQSHWSMKFNWQSFERRG